jgi:protein subunit release factor A
MTDLKTFLKDVSVEYVKRTGPQAGGGLVNSPSFEFVLTHNPTQTRVELNNLQCRAKSAKQVLVTALRILRVRVWQSENLNLDQQVKTYHCSPRGIYTKDHITGETTHGRYLGEQV